MGLICGRYENKVKEMDPLLPNSPTSNAIILKNNSIFAILDDLLNWMLGMTRITV